VAARWTGSGGGRGPQRAAPVRVVRRGAGHQAGAAELQLLAAGRAEDPAGQSGVAAAAAQRGGHGDPGPGGAVRAARGEHGALTGRGPGGVAVVAVVAAPAVGVARGRRLADDDEAVGGGGEFVGLVEAGDAGAFDFEPRVVVGQPEVGDVGLAGGQGDGFGFVGPGDAVLVEGGGPVGFEAGAEPGAVVVGGHGFEGELDASGDGGGALCGVAGEPVAEEAADLVCGGG